MVNPTYRPHVLKALKEHDITPLPDESPEQAKERLNDRYLSGVRNLKSRQLSGEIPLSDYARHAQALKESFPLLGLPLSLWIK